jgi:hypothetical protein
MTGKNYRLSLRVFTELQVCWIYEELPTSDHLEKDVFGFLRLPKDAEIIAKFQVAMEFFRHKP